MPDPNTILHHGAILFLQPKVANTSIKSALMGTNKDVHLKQNFTYVGPDYAEEYPEYVRATFVRNPFDRLVSAYQNKVAGRPRSIKTSYRRVQIRAGMNFWQFVYALTQIDDDEIDLHFRPQINNIKASGVPLKMDFIGRFENMADEWARLCEHCHFPQKTLPIENQTGPRNYRWYYDDRLIEWVAERYKEDLNYFGYEF